MNGAGTLNIPPFSLPQTGVCTIRVSVHFESHFEGSLEIEKGTEARSLSKPSGKAGRGRASLHKPTPFKSQGRVARVVWGLCLQGNWALKQSRSSLLKRKHTTGLMPACAKVSHTEAVR